MSVPKVIRAKSDFDLLDQKVIWSEQKVKVSEQKVILICSRKEWFWLEQKVKVSEQKVIWFARAQSDFV